MSSRRESSSSSSSSVSRSSSSNTILTNHTSIPATAVTDIVGMRTNSYINHVETKDDHSQRFVSLQANEATTSFPVLSTVNSNNTLPRDPNADLAPARRSSRTRAGFMNADDSCNVDVLADRQRKRKEVTYAALGVNSVGSGGDSRNISGETLVGDDPIIRPLLVKEEMDKTEMEEEEDKNLDSSVISNAALSRRSARNASKTDGMVPERVKREEQNVESSMKRRQSIRLQHATSHACDAVSSLGKRGREMMESGMGRVHALGRRGSTRLRDAMRSRMANDDAGIAPSGQRAMENPNGPPAKKIRLSPDVVTEIASEKATSSGPTFKKPRIKRWLASGLYTGQERDLNPKVLEAKKKVKRKSGIEGRVVATLYTDLKFQNPRKFLPMPMFAGERLLERGRPFQLPYDVFAPLSERQPKPGEWRKTSRSMYTPFHQIHELHPRLWNSKYPKQEMQTD